MKRSITQYHVSSFPVVMSGIKFRHSSVPVRSDYEKRLLVETSGAVMSFKEAGGDPGIRERKELHQCSRTCAGCCFSNVHQSFYKCCS
jgi:hypothetical protein